MQAAAFYDALLQPALHRPGAARPLPGTSVEPDARRPVRDGDLAVIARADRLLRRQLLLPEPGRGPPTRDAADAVLGASAVSWSRRAYPRTAFGWPVVPDGLTETAHRAAGRAYGDRLPPIYITENGCAYDDAVDADGAVHDPDRVAYLDGHLRAVRGRDRRRRGRARLLRAGRCWTTSSGPRGTPSGSGWCTSTSTTQPARRRTRYALVPRPDRRPDAGPVGAPRAARRGRAGPGHAGAQSAASGRSRWPTWPSGWASSRPSSCCCPSSSRTSPATREGRCARPGDRRRRARRGGREPAGRRAVRPHHVPVRPAAALAGRRHAARRARPRRPARDSPLWSVCCSAGRRRRRSSTPRTPGSPPRCPTTSRSRSAARCRAGSGCRRRSAWWSGWRW